MDSRNRSPRARAAAALVAAAALALGTGGPPAAAAASAPGPRLPAARAAAVTLITGDRVRLLEEPGGGLAVGIEPAPGRERVGFLHETHTGERGTDVSVVPADAAPLLAAGRLDPRLFDVTELARQGLTDAAGPALPLIVAHGPGLAPPAVPAADARTVRSLPSIGGAAVRQDRRRGSGFWRWLTGASGARSGARPRLAAGVAKVWLDGVSRPLLDRSVPQIGGPTAWRAGLTGRGVTVGVLDTGIKADHPDLAGRVVEARDFTGTRPDAADDVGHGTHVAGVIAGSGAASGGRYRGVAPDAELVSGKVCASWGCPDSAVIAGMEWIAPKARVVNMSLGGGASDGGDPVSQALNRLSGRYGTLFVAAAGDGDDPLGSVAAPAAADDALAVGSVTRQDETSPFSSRGPRLGDRAVKPDIAAPGSGIVSARAPGTPDGDLEPVDGAYAVQSGTSVAAPHVAGAAAVLAQQHPDWTAGRLKAALTSTAKPTASVFEQGAGRVDVARAVTQPLTASGSLGYGFFAWPHVQRVSRTVTYRNDGDGAVTLSLSVAASAADGRPAPAGLFTPSPERLTVPAHGSAVAGVTADPAAGGAGLYGGRLTAAGAGVTVQTPLDAYLEPESYDLTVRLISRTGHFVSGLGQAVDTATGQAFGIRPFDAGGTAVVRLPRARYDLNALDLSAQAADQSQPSVITLLSRPGLTLAADTTVTLDATAGRPVAAVVDRPDARLQFGELGLQSTNPAGDRGSALSWFAQPRDRLFAVPTGAKVSDHPYAFFFRATLAAVEPGSDPAASVYHLAFLERGRIPANPAYRARDRDLATVSARYHTQGVPSGGFRSDFARLPLPATRDDIFELYRHTLPSRRTEHFTASPEVTWMHLLAILPADESDVEITWSIRSYAPGRYRSAWNRAPLGPAFGQPSDGWGVTRAGDQLLVAVTLLSGSDRDQFTSPPLAMTGATTLLRDGAVLAASTDPGLGTFPIPDTPGIYTLHATATRSVPWSVIGGSADVTWTFHEPGAAAAAAPLPLLVIRASGEVDDQGRAPAGTDYPLSLEMQRQPGAPPARLAGLGVEASYDDGATWTAAPTAHRGDGGFALLHHPPGDGFVSLRISARDADGNAVTQTVIRAYQLVRATR